MKQLFDYFFLGAGTGHIDPKQFLNPPRLSPKIDLLVLLLVGRDFLCIAFAREKRCSVAREGARTPSTCITSVNLSFIGLLFRYMEHISNTLEKMLPDIGGKLTRR